MEKVIPQNEIIQTDKQDISSPSFQDITHYKVTKFRDNIKSILDDVHSGKTVLIDVRDVPYAFMIPVDAPVAPVGSYEYQIACIISEKLLRDAPMHIIKPQIDEFAKLDRDELFALMEIEEFPLSTTIRKKILSKLRDPNILERLEKRRKIADSISLAEREGLYEASEHATGLLTFK